MIYSVAVQFSSTAVSAVPSSVLTNLLEVSAPPYPADRSERRAPGPGKLWFSSAGTWHVGAAPGPKRAPVPAFTSM